MKEVQAGKKEPMPSKYPAKYRIDLHIDDDPSVMQNGKVYGFRVFIVGPPDYAVRSFDQRSFLWCCLQEQAKENPYGK